MGHDEDVSNSWLFYFYRSDPLFTGGRFLFGGRTVTRLTPLKLTRLKRGLSQWHVAKETGILQTLISLYERELKEPKPEHKESLAKLYGKKVQELWE